MFFDRVFTSALLCLVLAPAAHAASHAVPHWYRPYMMPSVESAADRIRSLSAHLKPVTITEEKFYLTEGYELVRSDANSNGLTFVFRKYALPETARFYWDWGSVGYAPRLTPQSGDLTTSIVFGEIGFFQIWNIFQDRDQIASCVVPMRPATGRNDVVCLEAQQDAEALVDALATLVKASGGHLHSPFGVWGQQGWFHDVQNGQTITGWTVAALDPDGPPAKSGIEAGDVLYKVNGNPLRAASNFLAPFAASAGAALEGGTVDVELIRRGILMTVEVEYPALGSGQMSSTPDLTALVQETSQLRSPASTAAPAPPPSPTPLPLPASSQPPAAAPTVVMAAATGTRMGVQVRSMTPSDAAIYRVVAHSGIVILNVERGGMAEAMQLQAGDVILEVNGSAVGSLDSFAQTVRGGELRTLRVWRNGQPLNVAVAMSQ